MTKKALAEWLIAKQITQTEFNILDDLFANKAQKFTSEEITNLLQEEKQKKLREQEQRKKFQEEQEKKEQKNWFSSKRWLTDKEIDWALEQINLASHRQHFTILPSWQALTTHYESKDESDPEIFREFYHQLAESEKEIIIIPVNNPDFHWSLLVYEAKKKIFHHYDTLSGANWSYIRPLCQQLLTNLEIKEREQKKHLITHHKFAQGNSYDCGVGVIAIVERLITHYCNYQCPWNDKELGKDLNLKQERKKWRNKISELVNNGKKNKKIKKPPRPNHSQQEQPTNSNSFFAKLNNFNWWWLLLVIPVLVFIVFIKKIKGVF
jgi:hypothetical protein